MAGNIPQQFIDEVLARTDIVELIDARVPLTRGGKDYKACCPFHEERTASFTVSPAKQFYHCFGCGAHGTAISFLMAYQHLGFREAIEELASRAGLARPAESGARPASSSNADLLDVLRAASKYYQRQLRSHPDAAAAVDYLKDRGLSGGTAARFGIGFAPDGWDNVVRALGTSDAALGRLERAGLVTRRSGGGHYDRFRHRIMFPIEDHRGRTVGFGGRVIGDGEPKYLNSPETPLFHKGSELYGLHSAGDSMRDSGHCLVVEGYMDVVSLAQAGIDNVVATLGTATTRTHLQRLFRICPGVVFCFDGDRAGRAAAWRALETAMGEAEDGRQFSFLFLPAGEDPDTLVRREGAESFRRRVDAAMPLTDYLFSELSEQTDLRREDGRARLVKLAHPYLEKLPEGVLRDLMWGRLSQLAGIDRDRLRVRAAGRDSTALRSPKLGQAASRSGPSTPQELAAAALVQYPDRIEITDLSGLESLRLPGMKLLLRLAELLRAEPGLTTAALLERARDTEWQPHLEMLAASEHLGPEENVARVFSDAIRALEDKVRENEIGNLLEKSEAGRLDTADKERLRLLLGRKHASRDTDENVV